MSVNVCVSLCLTECVTECVTVCLTECVCWYVGVSSRGYMCMYVMSMYMLPS